LEKSVETRLQLGGVNGAELVKFVLDAGDFRVGFDGRARAHSRDAENPFEEGSLGSRGLVTQLLATQS